MDKIIDINSQLTNKTKRIEIIKKEINTSMTYYLTKEELKFGARMAWRNASRYED